MALIDLGNGYVYDEDTGTSTPKPAGYAAPGVLEEIKAALAKTGIWTSPSGKTSILNGKIYNPYNEQLPAEVVQAFPMASQAEVSNAMNPNGIGNNEGGSDWRNIAMGLGAVSGASALFGGPSLFAALGEALGWTPGVNLSAQIPGEFGFGDGLTDQSWGVNPQVGPQLTPNQLLENFAAENPGNMGFNGDVGVPSGPGTGFTVPPWFGAAATAGALATQGGGSANDKLAEYFKNNPDEANGGFKGDVGVENTGESAGIVVPSTFGEGLTSDQLKTVTDAVGKGISLKDALGLAGVAAPIISGLLGSNAIGNAANSQLDAARLANDTLNKQFETTREDFRPWREAGANALNMLTTGINPGGEFTKGFETSTFTSPDFKFETDPGYQFRLAEGEKAIERAAAARRMRNSGATYKDLLRFGQNTASNEFDRAFNRFDTNRKFDYNKFTTDETNRYNRFNTDRTTRYNQLAGVAGTGQNAMNTVANAGATTAGSVANNITGAGNVNAGATIAGVNALNSGISSALKGYNDAELLDYFKTRELATPRTATVGSY